MEELERFQTFSTLEEAKKNLLLLKSAKKIDTKNWGIYEICMHCAQTISYSMTGYPKMKPWIIRNTVGRIVIAKFLKQGYMKHNLQAHVDGGEAVILNKDSVEGINHLLSSIEELEHYKGTFKPHSVFGELSKEDYIKYFAMHISDHFSEISIEH